MSPTDEYRYDDIIDLPRFVSQNHPHMSNYDRAAQFAPFAALTGFGDSIKETGRLTQDRPELSDEEREEMDLRFRILEEHFKEDPFVHIRYFVPDKKKMGGGIIEKAFEIHQIDTVNEVVIATDRKQYDMNAILDINGDIITKYKKSRD